MSTTSRSSSASMHSNPPESSSGSSPIYCIPYYFKKKPLTTLSVVVLINSLISMVSAAIIIELEGPAQVSRIQETKDLETEVLHLKEEFLKDFQENTFTEYSSKLKALSIKKNNKEIIWDMLAACAFITSVSSTTGYGDIVPVTLGGKIFTIAYALYGIPIFIWYIVKLGVLFRVIIMRFIFWGLRILEKCCSNRKKKNRLANVLNSATETEEDLVEDKRFHPSIIGVILLLFLVSVSGFISYMEDITYFDAFYACFITYSTIGFGDIDIYRISFRSNWFNLMIYGNFVHIVGYMIVSAWISSILDRCGDSSRKKK